MNTPKKHHYHPQWLLRRFRRSVDSDHVYQFQIGHEPRCVAIRDAGSETRFHGPPEAGLEGMLSKGEGRDARLMREVDASSDLSRFHDEISSAVWILAARAKAARDGFASATSDLVNAFANELQTPAGLAAFHSSANAGFDRHLRELYPRLREQSPVPVPDHVFHAFARAQFLRLEVLKHVPSLASMAADAVDAAKIAQDGHIKALARVMESPAELQVPSLFKGLKWRVRRIDRGTFVLGDCVAFSLTDDGKPRPLFSIVEKTASIYAPISPQAVLIADAPSSPPELTPEQVSACAAMCSSRVFFASRNTSVEQSLKEMIGKCSGFATEETVRRVVHSAIAEPRQQVDPRQADEAKAVGVPPDQEECDRLRRLGRAALDESHHVGPSGRSTSEVLHLLLRSASLLASGYLVAADLPSSVCRARFDIRRMLPVDVTPANGPTVLGVGGLVGPSRGPARLTIVVVPDSSPSVLWTNDLHWWRVNS